MNMRILVIMSLGILSFGPSKIQSMPNYLELLATIKNRGVVRSDRTGTGTISILGPQLRFDLAQGFPILTTKKVFFKSVIAELLWFLSGSTNVHDLQKMNCHIWDEWADKETGELGPIYGHQWRSWTSADGKTIDQIQNVIDSIKLDANSRRHIVCSWNVGEIHKMALPPCHCLFQFYVAEGKLSCMLYQRSCDVFLGLPFNIASYALLTHMIAQQCDLQVGEFVWTGCDAHLYLNHMEQVNLQLSRDPRTLPILSIKRKPSSIFEYVPDDFELIGYNPHGYIKAPIAV